ncbi:MAG: DUF1638 domain-containing protein [Syntrophobacteraceae bacterium]
MTTVILACGIMRAELDEVLRGAAGVDVRYLEQALHRTPHLMTGRIQTEIDAVSSYADRIVLGCGLCSNGVVGVAAGRQGITMPRCHDCIALFLGSRAAYDELFNKIPGTYYLTPGWIDEKKDPLGIVQDDYTPRVGYETAVWAMRQELKHYTHIALISSGLADIEACRQRAKENAAFFRKQYIEIKGNLDYFRKMICSDTCNRGICPDDFVFVPSNLEITQEMFF